MTALEDLLKYLSEGPPLEGGPGLVILAERLAQNPDGIALLWILAESFADTDEPSLVRTLSYHISNDAPIAGPGQFVALLSGISDPIVNDYSTFLNLLNALTQNHSYSVHWQSAVSSHLPGFFLRCLEQPPFVAERALDVLCHVAYPLYTRNTETRFHLVLDAMNSLVGRVDNDGLQLEWLGALSSLRKKLATSEPIEDPVSGQHPFIEAGTAIRRIAERCGPDVAQLATSALAAVRRRLGITSARAANAAVQRVTLTARGREVLALQAISRITEAWNDLFTRVSKSFGKPVARLVPQNAIEGSYVLQLAVSAPDDNARKAFGLVQQLCSMPARLFEHPELAPAWSDLLHRLASEGAEMQVVQSYGPGAQHGIVTLGAIRTTTLAIEADQVLSSRLRSADIPQADELARVLHIVDVLAGGAEPDVASMGGITPRQVNYYRHAARTLGLLSDAGGLTPAGWQLARLPTESRYRSLVVHFEGSVAGEAWVRWARVTDLRGVPEQSAEAFLSETVIDLSAATVGRRAKTLEAWRTVLLPYHYG